MFFLFTVSYILFKFCTVSQNWLLLYWLFWVICIYLFFTMIWGLEWFGTCLYYTCTFRGAHSGWLIESDSSDLKTRFTLVSDSFKLESVKGIEYPMTTPQCPPVGPLFSTFLGFLLKLSYSLTKPTHHSARLETCWILDVKLKSAILVDGLMETIV